MKYIFVTIINFCLFAFIAILFTTCGIFETEDPNENTAPNTTIANIPVEGDTIFALANLSWDGEDNDGFIATYRYRYTTFAMSPGQTIDNPDTIITHEWVDTSQTSVTIAFDSPSPVNFQVFEVAAVDNDGNVDETPAKKEFFTFPTKFPETRLLVPRDDREDTFAKPDVDEWWEGVLIRYTASDDDGEIIEYAWAVNDGPWHWTTDTAVFIHPSEFHPELEGTHTIRVTSKDNTLLIDPVGDSRRIDLEVAAFERDIMIIDETSEDASLPDFNGMFTDEMVDSMYFENFGGNDRGLDILEWDFNLRGLPSFRRLKLFKMVVWHKDHFGLVPGTGVKASQRAIEEYLRMGGKLVLMGSRVMWQYMNMEDFQPPPFDQQPRPEINFNGPEDQFVNVFLHINVAAVTNLRGDNGGVTSFTGVFPEGNFTGEFQVDPTKFNPGFPNFGRMNRVYLFKQLGGFAVPIIQYNGLNESLNGLPCGLRYFGSVFDLIFLGFPMWHLEGESAKRLGDQILDSMGF